LPSGERPGLGGSDVSRREDQAFAVGSESDLLGATEGLRRAVGIHAAHEIDQRSTADLLDEQVRPTAILPGVPMPDEQLVVDLATHLGGLTLIEPLTRAVQ